MLLLLVTSHYSEGLLFQIYHKAPYSESLGLRLGFRVNVMVRIRVRTIGLGNRIQNDKPFKLY